MGFWARLRQKGTPNNRKKQKISGAPPRRQDISPRFTRKGSLFICSSCGHKHDFFPYLCRGCGNHIPKNAQDRDLEVVYKRLRPDLAPMKSLWLCECGHRYKKEDAFCARCQSRTHKKPSFPLPNFEIQAENRIRCAKCLKTKLLKQRLDLSVRCGKCNNAMLVADYKKIFTGTRPVIPDLVDETLNVPAIAEQAAVQTREWRVKKRRRTVNVQQTKRQRQRRKPKKKR